MEQKKRRLAIVKEYLAGEGSVRQLALKYGVKASTLHRWVKASKAGMVPGGEVTVRGRRAVMVTYADVEDVEDLPEDVKELQRELKEARLYNKLLNAMIDIAEEQMGAVIRKKSGAKQ